MIKILAMLAKSLEKSKTRRVGIKAGVD